MPAERGRHCLALRHHGQGRFRHNLVILHQPPATSHQPPATRKTMLRKAGAISRRLVLLFLPGSVPGSASDGGGVEEREDDEVSCAIFSCAEKGAASRVGFAAIAQSHGNEYTRQPLRLDHLRERYIENNATKQQRLKPGRTFNASSTSQTQYQALGFSFTSTYF